MKGDAKVIDHLNTILKNELTAINQYMLHARLLGHWGLTKLAAHEFGESKEEMLHADKIMQRLLFLDGKPNMQDMHKLMIGDSVESVLHNDLKLEEVAIPALKAAITDCEKLQDFVTRDLLKAILTDEEGHVDFIETQLELLARMGLPNYIQLQAEAPTAA